MRAKHLLILFITALSFNVSAQFTTLLNADGPDLFLPYGTPISDGTFLYAMTTYGGVNNDGTIFKVLPDGTAYQKIFDFDDITTGKNPMGSLFFDGTFLYGMTGAGGANNNNGVIFRIMPDGTMFSKLFDFFWADGARPYYGHLISDGTFLYGMTSFGGLNYGGVLFKIKPDGTAFTHVLDFSDTISGSIPFGSLIYDGAFLYGMTCHGGSNWADGTIFRIMPDGTNYLKLHDFIGNLDGVEPLGSLTSDGTFLYGMTKYGGISGDGVIFKIMPGGTAFSKLFDFNDSASGGTPFGTLVYDGTSLYGLTGMGGYLHGGTIFKILPNGTGYSTLYDFTGSPNGTNPWASLFYDGTFFYGTTTEGGMPWSNGTLFKFKEDPSGIIPISFESNLNLYPNPSGGIFSLDSKNHDGEILVYNMIGEIVFQSTITSSTPTIDLSDQSNGIYFVSVKTEGELFTEKIAIQK